MSAILKPRIVYPCNWFAPLRFGPDVIHDEHHGAYVAVYAAETLPDGFTGRLTVSFVRSTNPQPQSESAQEPEAETLKRKPSQWDVGRPAQRPR